MFKNACQIEKLNPLSIFQFSEPSQLVASYFQIYRNFMYSIKCVFDRVLYFPLVQNWRVLLFNLPYSHIVIDVTWQMWRMTYLQVQKRCLNQRFSTQTTPRPVFLKKKFHDPLLWNLNKIVVISRSSSMIVLSHFKQKATK
jgi:hypothetical protein